MKHKMAILVLLAANATAQADLIDIVASGSGANVETISQVVMDVTTTSGTSTITQNAPDLSASKEASSAILKSITTSGVTLNQFSALTPTIHNETFPATASNIEVFTPTAAVNVADASFFSELAEMHSTGDLMQYLRVDSTSAQPMWDIRYGATFDSSDYLVVEERNGNTTFTVEALDALGNTIPGSDTLSFDGSSYDWDIGYANELDPFSNQSQVMSVLSFDLFNTTTPIGGFRIHDTGQADFKFFIGTSTPEPSALSLAAMLAFCGVRRRSRQRKPTHV
ncbi:MAG: hypothetical protein AB8G99_05295 [Planctomycetaceae bacterium]